MSVQIDGDKGINKVQDGCITSGSFADSVNLPGKPTAVTAPPGTKTVQLATTEFVVGEKGGRRNYLINGNFDKWDYATSQTTSAYGSDNRWWNGNVGSTKTHSQVACGDTERALFNAMYFSRTVVASVAGAGNLVNKWQAIENVNLLAGKTVTLSFWARADAARNIAVEFVQCFGTGGNPSPYNTCIGSQLVALTTTWQKKTITVTLPSIVGKTLGSDGVQTTFTAVNFLFDAGSNSAIRSANLGQQSGTFDIAQVKLEDGLVATNGWHPYDGEFGSEIQACGRYYEIVDTSFITSYAVSGNNLGGKVQFAYKKRTTPTLTFVADAVLHTSVNTGITYVISTSVDEFVEYRTMQASSGAMQFSSRYTASSEF
jgi:hypothetical protein